MNEFLIRAGYLPKIVPQASESRVALSGDIEPRVIEGVGIVPISGILMNGDSFMSFFFGGVTYQYIRGLLAEYASNKSVKAVMLDINSPGGDAYGVAELAEYIRSYSKPVVAYVSGQAASAAYWLAAASGIIVSHKTAFVGSIGTYAIVEKVEGESFIVSEQSPKKVPDPSTDEGAAQIRRHMNTMTEHFLSDVAEYRGKDRDYVAANFGQGDVENASAALSVGMIDKIGNFETALNAAQSYNSKSNPAASGKKNFGGTNMARSRVKAEFVIVDGDAVGEDVPVQEVTPDLIKELFPDVATALIEEGKNQEAAETAEVDEAASMADLTDDEEKEAVAQARAKKISAAELTKRLLALKSAKVKAAQALSARAADEIPPLGGTGAPASGVLASKLRLMRSKKK